MVGNPLFFGRKYRLTLAIPGQEEKVFEVEEGRPAMDIKFDVTYARGQTAREGTVSILGLGHETIHNFISQAAITRGEAMQRQIRVKLEAGYFSAAGMIEILDGFAWYATVTSPPQMWLNIKVAEYNVLGGRKVNFGDMQDLTMAGILTHVTDRFTEAEGVKFCWEDKTEDYVVKNSKETQKSSLVSKGALSLSETIQVLNQDLSDKVQCTLRSSRIDGTRILEVLDKDKKKSLKEPSVNVDKDNGLLSVTGIDVVNGCVTTFLDGRHGDELSRLKLTSELNQQANGTYYIIKKQYIGHFMGQEWYTRYFCSAREND